MTPLALLGLALGGAWLLGRRSDPLAYYVGAAGDGWMAGPSLQPPSSGPAPTVTYSQVQALDAAADGLAAEVDAWWKAQAPPSGPAAAFKTAWDAWYIGLQAWVTGALKGLPKAEYDAHQAKLVKLSGQFQALQPAAPGPAAPPVAAPSPAASPAPAAFPDPGAQGAGSSLAAKLKPLAPLALGGIGIVLIMKGLEKR